jgi:hypothetical protein
MSTVQELERAIERLSDAELAEIRAWLWDRDIERDAKPGGSTCSPKRRLVSIAKEKPESCDSSRVLAVLGAV